MNPSKLSLLFTLSLIFISFAPLPALGINLYENVCKDAGKDNARCLNLLKAYPQITSAKNYVELCRFILEMAIKKSTEGQNYLKGVMKKNPSPAIKECATVDYDELVESFKSSLGELVEDPSTANYDAKVAGDGPDTCDRALAQANIVDPSISTLNNNMKFLSNVAFFATNHLPQHH
ncbi:uncharacterized protein LOC133291567 [Gastrolobium bilobum]|uniref:uncharacterized protein LOC133291567 n=1 Tax=Gastrolobium bilobum TaxID=150636 RepID=UPI002AB078FE|nr:uncharacterized protein LOC133291567 [Gastrolobium bilobum]